MRGFHPDVIFARTTSTPYESAMRKGRDATGRTLRNSELRRAMAEDPDRFGLTEDEATAVQSVLRGG